jgi:hypothetical protein
MVPTGLRSRRVRRNGLWAQRRPQASQVVMTVADGAAALLLFVQIIRQ